jgi:hypothetical protein
MLKVIIYLAALTVLVIVSWELQRIHPLLGYTFGSVGVLTAFFLAIHEARREFDSE